MILSNKRITKALISLHICAGWSAPLLFENYEDRFSSVKAIFICTPECLLYEPIREESDLGAYCLQYRLPREQKMIFTYCGKRVNADSTYFVAHFSHYKMILYFVYYMFPTFK